MTVSYLVDTDWIIHYLNGQPEIVSKLQELQGRGVAVSLVSLAELYEGTYYSHDPEAREGDLNDFLAGVSHYRNRQGNLQSFWSGARPTASQEENRC